MGVITLHAVQKYLSSYCYVHRCLLPTSASCPISSVAFIAGTHVSSRCVGACGTWVTWGLLHTFINIWNKNIELNLDTLKNCSIQPMQNQQGYKCSTAGELICCQFALPMAAIFYSYSNNNQQLLHICVIAQLKLTTSPILKHVIDKKNQSSVTVVAPNRLTRSQGQGKIPKQQQGLIYIRLLMYIVNACCDGLQQTVRWKHGDDFMHVVMNRDKIKLCNSLGEFRAILGLNSCRVHVSLLH